MKSTYNQIVLFGDSITELSFDPILMGFGATLSSAYARRMDIINRGFAGYNTDWGLPILKQLLPTVKEQADDPSKIQLMTIFFGANDSGLPIAKAHVPIERYKDNLTTMVNMIKDTNSEYYNPSIRLVLITPPPVDEVKWKERCENQGDELNRTNENARLYGEVVKQIAREHGIVAIDVWSHFMSLDRHLSEFQVDGLHLNDKGNQQIFKLIMDTIQQHYPEIHPTRLNMELPSFSELVANPKYEELLQFPVLK